MLEGNHCRELAKELIELNAKRVGVYDQGEEEANSPADLATEIIADESGAEEKKEHQEIEA